MLLLERDGRGQADREVVDISRLLSHAGTTTIGPMVGEVGAPGQAVFGVQPVWFRPPSADRPGTLNLCFGALDVHVVRGRASEPAVRTGRGLLDFATVLEHVAALAGALRLLDVRVGEGVRLALDDPYDDLVAMLACARVGAVHGDVDRPVLLVTSRDLDDPAARARLLRGVAPRAARPGTERDVPWEMAVRAGRDDPAPCVPLAADATAWVSHGRPVPCREALEEDSATGRLHASLTAGRPVDLSGRPVDTLSRRPAVPSDGRSGSAGE